MRRSRLISGFAVGVTLVAIALVRPDRPFLIGVGAVAHDLCSAAFVSGLDPKQVFADSLAPRAGLRLIAPAITYDVDRGAHAVTARLAGVLRQRAIYYQGLGCVLIHGAEPQGLPSPAELAALRPDAPPLLPEIAGPAVVAPMDQKLKSALDHAFEEPEQPPFRRTKAIVIVHDGRVIAERYAPGWTVETPILGFSMTKSVINAFVGILVRQGRLQTDARAPVPAWQTPGDPRRLITIENLMRMTSGLDLDEEGAGFANRSDRMVYLARDMTEFAGKAKLIATPGTRWAYSSASTHILAQIIRDTVGGRAIDALGFAQRELFGPLGMRSAVMEVDATGTMVGSHYMLASARDWARFGLMYLDDGTAGGRRILPEGWIEFSARPTLGTEYGAGFWTNRRNAAQARAPVNGSMPRDVFFAAGNLGQRIFILPSQRLVIVRLGDATGPGNDARGLIRLVREVIGALGDEAAAKRRL